MRKNEQTDGRTEMTKLIEALRNFAKEPKTLDMMPCRLVDNKYISDKLVFIFKIQQPHIMQSAEVLVQ